MVDFDLKNISLLRLLFLNQVFSPNTQSSTPFGQQL